MKCVFCGHQDSKVVDSREIDDGESIRRRRECTSCKKRFTTYEKVEGIPLIVIKKDNARQIFNREKLLSGIVRACVKRPIPMAKLEQIVDDVENRIANSPQNETASTEIGEMVMRSLKNLDEVAYVRFASVYRQFKDINTFMAELNKLMGERRR